MDTYKIVSSDSLGQSHTEHIKNLEAKVKLLMEEQWQPLGSIVISFNDAGHIMEMYQTMVRYRILEYGR